MTEGKARTRLRGFAVVAFCVFACWTLPSSALAFPYEFAEENIGSPGSGDGQLELATHSGVAVNFTTDQVYVADSENHRVEVFSSSGAFVRVFGADVGGAGIDVCTSSCGAGTSEDAPGAFINPTFVAIDNNPLSPSFGDVYIADNATNTVSKFQADGDLITTWGEGGRIDGSSSRDFDEINGQHVVSGTVVEIAGIAVDSSGNLFVYQTGLGGFMFKFAETGTFIEDFEPPFATAPHGIAVDSTGDLYKVRGNELVVKFTPTGELIKEDIGCEGCAKAITVDPSNDDLYIARGVEVERYSSAGVLQETFGSSAEITKASGIAVNAGLETAYIADKGSNRIDVFGPQPPGKPEVKSTGVENITATAADLLASINPHRLDTHARFQYTTLAEFEAEGGFTGALETPNLDIGAGKVPVKTSAHLSGLLPGTTYVFRVVAVNLAGEDSTDEHEPAPSFATFTTPPAGLPDDRAYEMVSPSQKAGEALAPEPDNQLGGSCDDCLPGRNNPTMPMQSAPDGDSVLYLGQPFFSGLASGSNEYLAPRSEAGWGTQSLSPATVTGEYVGFSTDLSRGMLSQIEPPLSPEAPTRGGRAFQNLYLEQGGQFEPLVKVEPPSRNPGPGEFRIRFATANAGTVVESGFTHLLFEANDALTVAVPGVAPTAPGVEAGGACTQPAVECNLYEWEEGELALVNVLPGNEDAAGGAAIGAGRLLAGNQQPDVDHAISDDGSRVFFSSEETGDVYARVDGGETLEIPTPGPGTCKESEPLASRVCFLTASADGASVLLSNGQVYELNENEDEYEAGADLTLDESEIHQGNFQGILGAAEDLSRVYFVDTAALTEEDEEHGNANGEHAEDGKLNLYGWEEGRLTFIGLLLSPDREFGTTGRFGLWTASSAHRTAQVSADGSWLVFMSVASLTGYDNDLRGGGNCNAAGPACREVFVYSIESGTLVCASCNPTGQRPLGPSNLSLIRPNQGEVPPFPQPRNLARDGSGRLFFESQDELSPRDINGHIQDVYEWEPSGVGSCELADGCVSLISSGTSPDDSMFLDSSLSGDDAFFITRQRLLPRDKDDLLDLYDARVGGGFEEIADPPCNGEECPAPPADPPIRPRFASSTFTGGPESSTPTKPRACKKGFVKKHGKCVKKKHKKKSSAKRNRGGSK